MRELPLPEEQMITLGAGGRLAEMAFRLFGYASPFVRQARRVNPVLIHAHFGPDGTLALPIARALGIPLIVTFHGYDATIHREVVMKYPFYDRHRIYFQKEAFLQREGKLFIAASEFTKRKLVARGFSPDRIKVHYIGVDTRMFQPDPDPPRHPVVIFVGRLVEVKGCEYLLQAMKNVQRQVPDVQLMILGDGPLRPALERLARSEGIANCQFLGWQPHQNVHQWLKQAMIYCMPSIVTRSGAEEGMSIAMLEAMACGLPVAGFSNGGTPEAVDHGKTGFLAEERNVVQLSDYIIRLLMARDLWKDFSLAARARVCSNFDLQRQTEKLEELYRSVL